MGALKTGVLCNLLALVDDKVLNDLNLVPEVLHIIPVSKNHENTYVVLTPDSS